MKNIILIFFASAFLFSCSNGSVDVLPNLSVVISSPDDSEKTFGDTIGIYLGSDLATSINVTITGGTENLEVYNNTLTLDSENGSCTGPGCLDCLAQENGHPDECGCNECLVKDTDFRFVCSWIPVCNGDVCASGSYTLVAIATNEDGQSGSISVSFLVEM